VSNNSAELMYWHLYQVNQLDVPVLLKFGKSADAETLYIQKCLPTKLSQLALAKRFTTHGGDSLERRHTDGWSCEQCTHVKL